jgi:hypothetical protein
LTHVKAGVRQACHSLVHQTRKRSGSAMFDHFNQAPVLLFIGMMASFGLTMLYVSVEDAIRR